MSKGLKFALIVGGGAVLLGGGYLAYRYFSGTNVTPVPESKGKKSGPFDWIVHNLTPVGWLGLDKVADQAVETGVDLLKFPQEIMTIIKWTAVGGGVLIAVMLLVFTYRMAIGNTPDVAGGVAQVMGALPQAQVMNAIRP